MALISLATNLYIFQPIVAPILAIQGHVTLEVGVIYKGYNNYYYYISYSMYMSNV